VRLQRVLHVISAIVFLALGALTATFMLLTWRHAYGSTPGLSLQFLRFLATWALPWLALGVLYLRPFRTGRWVALVLLAGFALQFGHTAARSGVRASQYAAIAHGHPPAGARFVGPQGVSPQDARFFQKASTYQATLFGAVALWFAAQLLLVALSRRYWERIPDEPRPAAGPPALPPPPS